MGSFLDNLLVRYRQGNVVTKFIYYNVSVFILMSVASVLLKLLGVHSVRFDWLCSLPASWNEFLHQPWSILTYMFLHNGLMHLLFNMLWLYYFGNLFLRFLSEKHFLTIYVLGGIIGGAFYMIGCNCLPYFEHSLSNGILQGASAAIMAVTLSLAFYRPNDEISVFFLGRIQLKWLVGIVVFIDFISLTSENGGGHLAHLGGALVGALVGLLMQASGTWSFPRTSTASSKKQRVYHRPSHETTSVDQDYRDQRKAEEDKRDAILDKIKLSGYDSLTREEKQFLFESRQ